MAFRPQRLKRVGLAVATSANGTTRAGAVLNTDTVGNQGLAVACVADITTNLVTATFTPQVSNDNVTWFNWKAPQAPAQVVAATGTGTQVVTSTALVIDSSVRAWQYFRCNALLAAAATAAADKTTVDYLWADSFVVN